MTITRTRDLPDQLTYLPMPLQVLHEAIGTVDDLLELKVVLTVLRGLARQRAGIRWVSSRELMADPALARALAALAEEERVRLIAGALQRACERGLFVCGRNDQRDSDDVRYTLSTPTHRRALEAAGWHAADGEMKVPTPATVPPRSSIFDLYEQNIGLVTPLLADELRDAEQAYPAEWIEEAFREAVGYNKRNWRYIHRILENWATEGKGERGAPWRRAEAARNRRRNLGGRFGPIAN